MFGSSDRDLSAPPPPLDPVPAGGNARYVYLLTRLRNRQITMEEATELFAQQQGMIRTASHRRRVPPPSAGAIDASGPAVSETPPMGLGAMTDDGFALSLLALGAGAGVLAAVLRRSRAENDAPTADR